MVVRLLREPCIPYNAIEGVRPKGILGGPVGWPTLLEIWLDGAESRLPWLLGADAWLCIIWPLLLDNDVLVEDEWYDMMEGSLAESSLDMAEKECLPWVLANPEHWDCRRFGKPVQEIAESIDQVVVTTGSRGGTAAAVAAATERVDWGGHSSWENRLDRLGGGIERIGLGGGTVAEKVDWGGRNSNWGSRVRGSDRAGLGGSCKVGFQGSYRGWDHRFSGGWRCCRNRLGGGRGSSMKWTDTGGTTRGEDFLKLSIWGPAIDAGVLEWCISLWSLRWIDKAIEKLKHTFLATNSSKSAISLGLHTFALYSLFQWYPDWLCQVSIIL